MTELKVYSDNSERAYAEKREPFDLDINFDSEGVAEKLGSVNSRKQRGYISAYIKRGTVPTAKSAGIDWADFVLHKKTWAEICSQIEESIQFHCGIGQFIPQLNKDTGRYQLTIVDMQG